MPGELDERARRVRKDAGLARFSQANSVMDHSEASILRAEARLLANAGVLLLAVGFPLTMFLVAGALAEEGRFPILPLALGLPPILLGYLACHFAARRLMRGRQLEASTPALAAAANNC